MKIVRKKLAELVKPARNVRRHPENQLKEISRSIRSFGQIRPIVIDEEGVILAGNGLYESLLYMGKEEADCYVVNKLDEVQKKKLMLADNRIYSLGEDDFDVIDEFFRELNGDLDIPGFDDDFISRFVSADIAAPEDESADGCTSGPQSKRESVAIRHGGEPQRYIPVEQHDIDEESAPPICGKGERWQLGNHVLMCGDSTNPEDVRRLMGEDIATMGFTDPPWNVDYGGRVNPFWKRRTIINDNLSDTEYTNLLNGWIKAAKPYLLGDLYCVLGAAEWPRLDAVLRDNGMHWSGTIIWAKDSFVLGRSNYHRRYEPIWYGWPASEKSSFCGRRDLDDVWEIPRPKRSDEHPTMKPIELVARAIENSSEGGDIVMDGFGGSGTTLIACEQVGRRCRMLEISPHYCDVIIHRWQVMTGQTATLLRQVL